MEILKPHRIDEQAAAGHSRPKDSPQFRSIPARMAKVKGVVMSAKQTVALRVADRFDVIGIGRVWVWVNKKTCIETDSK